MIQPERNAVLPEQVSATRSRILSIQNNYELSTQRNSQKAHGDASSVTGDSNSNHYKDKSKMSSGLQQNRKTFTLDSSLTIHECNEYDSEESIQDE